MPDGDEVILRLAYRPPYDWDALRAYLAARPHLPPDAAFVIVESYARPRDGESNISTRRTRRALLSGSRVGSRPVR